MKFMPFFLFYKFILNVYIFYSLIIMWLKYIYINIYLKKEKGKVAKIESNK